MTTTAFYPDANPETSTVDGYAGRSAVDESWASIRGGSGNANSSSGTVVSVSVAASSTTNQWLNILRGIYLFDTSAIGSGNDPTSATFNFYATDKLDNFSQSMDIVAVTPASNTDTANADYGTFGTTLLGTISISSITTSAWNSITLNSDGLAAISLTGITKLGLRLSGDRTNTEPTWSHFGDSHVNLRTADYSGGSHAPYLNVTYPGGSPTLTTGMMMGGC